MSLGQNESLKGLGVKLASYQNVALGLVHTYKILNDGTSYYHRIKLSTTKYITMA